VAAEVEGRGGAGGGGNDRVREERNFVREQIARHERIVAAAAVSGSLAVWATGVSVCKCVYVPVCTRMCQYACVYVCVYVCTCVCLSVCLYECMYVYTHLCMSTHTYAYTHVCV
jgi:hypothetical protein